MKNEFIKILESFGFVNYVHDTDFWVNESKNYAIGLKDSNEFWTVCFDDELFESGHGFDFEYLTNLVLEYCGN